MTPIIRKIGDYAPAVTPIFDPEMGQRLRMVRLMLRLDQAALAKELGVSQRTVSGMERGVAGHRVAVSLEKFMRVFGEEALEFIVTAKHHHAFSHKYSRRMQEFAAEKEKRRT